MVLRRGRSSASANSHSQYSVHFPVIGKHSALFFGSGTRRMAVPRQIATPILQGDGRDAVEGCEIFPHKILILTRRRICRARRGCLRASRRGSSGRWLLRLAHRASPTRTGGTSGTGRTGGTDGRGGTGRTAGASGTSGAEGTVGTVVAVSVTVRDGEEAVACAAEKVAAMFEATHVA